MTCLLGCNHHNHSRNNFQNNLIIKINSFLKALKLNIRDLNAPKSHRIEMTDRWTWISPLVSHFWHLKHLKSRLLFLGDSESQIFHTTKTVYIYPTSKPQNNISFSLVQHLAVVELSSILALKQIVLKRPGSLICLFAPNLLLSKNGRKLGHKVLQEKVKCYDFSMVLGLRFWCDTGKKLLWQGEKSGIWGEIMFETWIVTKMPNKNDKLGQKFRFKAPRNE